jgi:electron-transferring-flavoprotein dehydrogenase
MSDRPRMDVDIVCVGFGPAMGGFLSTLAPVLGEFAIPPQVICYERADGVGFGVSGVVTKARGIRKSFPQLDPALIPMAAPVGEEKVVYLFDPHQASRRSGPLRLGEAMTRGFMDVATQSMELPWTPEFLHKTGGLVMSLGQFNQWVSEQLMMTGMVQVWPGMPVAEPLIENESVAGVRLADQNGEPGMDIRAALTVVGDGPFGPVGRKIDEVFGVPPGFERSEWAVGAKMVMDLPDGVDLEPGTVYHTIGYPEPEIFGFFYVHPERVASAGIFVPSWFNNPVRTSYRNLQHFIQHPFLWRFLKGGRLRSWGAKSILESGRRGEPYLCGHGYVRIGEGSGSTNVLTGSGVDEAWTTGILAAEGVIELLREKAPFTQGNLERAYVLRRRHSWVEAEGRAAQNARNGFQRGFISGMIGMGLAGLTSGQLNVYGSAPKPLATIEDYFGDRLSAAEIEEIRRAANADGAPLHDRLMDRAGWPPIPFDGRLLMTHQDALLLGGKVQAAPGFADHVHFLRREMCEQCRAQVCVEMCSGEAITPGNGVPAFDREKCVHCGACVWNCPNVEFRAGGGGLHSAEN